jgi:integrase
MTKDSMMDEDRPRPPVPGWATLLVSLAKPGAANQGRRPRKGSAMRQLNYELKQMCQRNRDGSYATQADRERTLSLIANQLHELGYRHMGAGSLKAKHVTALVARWQAEGLSAGTVKNRMTQLRWWAEKIGKPNVLARDNAIYGIADRVYVTNLSKGQVLTQEQLARVSDPYCALSLRFQVEFGLRRQESMLIQPALADRGEVLALQASWTKGSLAREIPIRTQAQRSLLDEAKALAGKGSLIPESMRYKDQLERFKSQCREAGIRNVHGFRHQYAQVRYREETGWACPACGGPTAKQLTPEQKALDQEARLMISRELGHGREQVTAVYLGR